MKRVLLLVGILILASLVFITCSEDKDPVQSTNRAPGQPTLDGPSGTPTDGATGTSRAPVLRWICTDPDGNPLKYTVSFGTTSPPPVVSTDQTTNEYSPATLEYSTLYYWSITAKDPAGASATSEEWSFTTLDPPTETISYPAAPTGPATGYVGQDLAFSGSAAVSNLAHDVEYRFDWGDGSALSGWSAMAITNSWAEGTYYVKSQARCVQHTAVESAWSSDSAMVVITAFAVETVGTPTTPSGSGGAEEGQSINFSVAAVTSSLGHNVRYRWDFGDGAPSTWSSNRSRSHAWASAGTYNVKAQARCADHADKISEWSPNKSVTITVAAAEVVTPPDAPGLPATGVTNVNVILTNMLGAASSDGHSVEYRFDYGDGEMSVWWYNWTTVQHSYSPAGTYHVSMQARCRTHLAIVSEWSDSATIVVSDPAEALSSMPGPIHGVANGQIDEAYEYDCVHGSVTNLGDQMEGQYDWGDGTQTAWVQWQDRKQTHTWTTIGTYNVTYQARCMVHNDFIVYSDTLVVTIVTEVAETISKPPFVNYSYTVRNPETNIEYSYTAYGGISSVAHDVEVMFDWGDGTQSDWVTQYTPVIKIWTTEGTFGMTRLSRCIAHPDILSEWSDSTVITAKGPETISVPDTPTGPASGIMNYYIYFHAGGAVSNWSHNLEYRFDWGNGTMSDWFRAYLGDSARYRWNTMGDYEIKAQARCIAHPTIESDWSASTTVNILETVTYNGSVTGPFDAPTNRSVTFGQNVAATSGAGHDLEYHFDFGDGTYSEWASELSASHTYTTAGSYIVKCQARCAVDTAAMSIWKPTYNHQIVVTDGPELVNVPVVSTSYTVTLGDSAAVRAYRSFSNYGDSLEYQIDFGDGTISDWLPTIYFFNWGGTHYWEMDPEWTYHTYDSVGSFGVRSRARCALHPAVISDWSEVSMSTTVEVIEFISFPATPTGPATGTVGENLTYSTTGSVSSEGHALEYYYSYRTASGQNAGSSEAYISSLSHTHVFASAGDYYVYVLVRCIEHHDASAGWSEKFYITITE